MSVRHLECATIQGGLELREGVDLRSQIPRERSGVYARGDVRTSGIHTFTGKETSLIIEWFDSL